MKKALLVLLFLIVESGLVQAASFSTNPNPSKAGDGVSATVQNAPGPNTITQSVDIITLTDGNSVSCNAVGLHADNSYIRRFDLSVDHGINGAFDVTSVTIGVLAAVSGDGGGQPLTVNLYTIPKGDALVFANLTQIGQMSNPNFPDQFLTIVPLTVTGTVTDPQTQDLVVEIFTPDGIAAGNGFFIGSNANGETAPSYLAAADCGVAEPVTLAALGWPDMHILMLVDGVEASAGQIPTLSEYGMIVLALLLAGIACIMIRRQQNHMAV